MQLGRRHLLALGLCLFWPRSALAGRKHASLEALMAHSDCCVIGRPVEAEARWTVLGGVRRIVTLQRVLVSEVLAGDARAGDELLVRTLGGAVGGVMQHVPGEAQLALNEPALLFLVRADADTHVVADMAGGHFAIERDASGVARVRAMARRALAPTETPAAVDVLSGASLEETRAMLRDMAWRPRAR